MGVSVAICPDGAEPAGRRAQALAFITSYLVRTGHSPSIGDIAAGLGVGRTRAKALVHQLATLKMIDRVPGSQRAISVPGLFEQLVVEKLRQEGWKVDRDIEVEPCPQEHLSLVAILEHVPAIAVGGSGDQQQ